MRIVTDQHEWNALVAPMLPASGGFLHAWAWGEFQSSVGRKVERVAGDGWAAQLITMPLPFGLSYLYCPKGPLTSPLTKGGLRGVIADELSTFARERGATFLRVEPREYVSHAVESAAIQPADTLITDLTKSEEALLAAMHEKTRYNIRLAERKGVEVTMNAAFDRVWPLFETTAHRGDFRVHPASYYYELLKTNQHVICAEAMFAGEAVATAIAIDFEGTRTYLHGASGDRHRNVMAPFFLHWELMKDAKAKGLKAYDWWGVAPADAPEDHPWTGITRFKLGFGGTRVSVPGTFDVPVSSIGYQVYRLGRLIRRSTAA